MTDLQRIDKWKKWLKKIKADAQNLVMYRSMFKEVNEIINENTLLHDYNHYFRYMNDSHIALIIMGLRRQIKNDPQSISITRLLYEIADNAQLITRHYYVSLYSNSSIQFLADEHFDQFCDDQGDPYISKSLVEADIDIFKEATLLVEKYADRIIAHTDKRKFKTFPTFEDVDNCLKILDKIYCKYHLMFYATSMDSLLPTFQYNWKKIFEIPWINNEGK